MELSFDPGQLADAAAAAATSPAQAVQQMGDLLLFAPELAVLAAALVSFVLSIIGVRYRTAWLGALVMAVVAVATTAAFLDATGEPFFPGIYRVDLFSQVLKLGLTVGLTLTLLVSSELGSFRPPGRLDLPFFLAMSTLGMMMLVSATELLTLYVSLELSAYGLYVVAALHRMQREGSEAGAKYLLYGAASSAVTIYGVSLIYGVVGSTYLVDVAAAPVSPLLLVGILLTLSGLLFKLAVFPFHAWAPDTYQGAPHQAATFIGTTSKVAAVGILVRVLTLAADPGGYVDIAPPVRAGGLFEVLLVLCVASMTVGNLAALVQRDIKRLLAWSTVAHAGYILIGLTSLSELGMASAIFYGLTYLVIGFLPFLVVCALGADGSNPTRDALRGLHSRSPLLALTLLVGMFGLAGIPPTPGFAGKWFLFSAALERGMLWLVLVGALNATVSLYYYLQLVRDAYVAAPEGRPAVALPGSFKLAAGLGLALVLYLGFYPTQVWELAERAARSVLGIVGG